ncbi:MAG: DUF2063 domain-containing protein [Bacteroidales bacterium]
MLTDHSTKKIQSSLAGYCRTGIPDSIVEYVHPERVKHYRRLVFNIINDSLQSAYPLIHQLLGETVWKETVNAFFSKHPCQSPQVWTMPREFMEYLIETGDPLLTSYPFLSELLLMEWTEVELFMMEDTMTPDHKHSLDEDGALVLNPEFVLHSFRYPVHLKNAGEIKESDTGQYYLVMHRHPEEGKVIFTDISPFYARLIEILSNQPLYLKQLAEITCQEFKIRPEQEIMNLTKIFIERLFHNGLILGTSKSEV